jgi:hypothetical protein
VKNSGFCDLASNKCLYEWLKKGGQTKTCPTCRETIAHKPVLSHHLKDITDSLIEDVVAKNPKRKASFDKQKEQAFAELVDDRRYQKEPFPLLFDKERGSNVPRSYIDAEDGVRRCPRCHWELEGAYCDNCDMEYDLGDDDAVGNRLQGEPGSENSYDESDQNEPNEYEHDDFVDDRDTDEILDGETSMYQDDWEVGSALSGNESLSGHYDSEEEDEDVGHVVRRQRPYVTTTTTRQQTRRTTQVVEVSDSSDEEVEERVARPSLSAARRAPVQVLDSDTSEAMDTDSGEPEARVNGRPVRRRIVEEDSD